MADKMMRMAGRGEDGKAKALRTNNQGDQYVQLTGSTLKHQTTNLIKTDFQNKTYGDTDTVPHIAKIAGESSIKLPPNFYSELSQDKYGSLMTQGDGAEALTKVTSSGLYAQNLYSFDVLSYYKAIGTIPESWTSTELKNNLVNIEVKWYGKGFGQDGVGAIVKYFIPDSNSWSSGKTQSVDDYNLISFNKTELADAIDGDGFVHIIAHSSSPASSENASMIYTDYIGLSAQLSSEILTVSDTNAYQKLEQVRAILNDSVQAELQGVNNKLTNTLKTEIQSSVTEEVKHLTASVMEKTHNFSITDYHTLTIQNLNQYTSVEVVLDDVFPTPASGSFTTPNPDDFDSVHLIMPGQVLKVRTSPSSVSYRSLAGEAKIKVIAGYDASVAPLSNESPFDNLQTLRYQVIAVDRKSSTIYSCSGAGLYKSEDGGKTWSRPYVFSGKTITGGFITKAGTLLVCFGIEKEVWRSTDGGNTFTQVLVSDEWRQFDSICQNTETGTIVFGENPDASADTINLYRSTDDGETFTEILTRSTSDIRHWHSVQIDPYTGKWVATTGDGDSQVEWWESDDDGLTWTQIVGGSSGVIGNQMYRTLGLFFTEDEYIWASDNPLWGLGKNFILSAPKNDIGNAKKGMSLPAPGYCHAQIGETWILGTMPEGATSIDRLARLYVSKDEGKTWNQVLTWLVKEGQPKGGFTSVSPTDQYGNLYVRLYYVEGYSMSPWWYATLKIKV